MVSDTLQLVFHKTLHLNLHYSISKKKDLDLIRAFGNYTGIDVIVYNVDTTYVDFDGVVVLNNFEQCQSKLYEEQLQARKVMDILNNKGEKYIKPVQLDGHLVHLEVTLRDGGNHIQN